MAKKREFRRPKRPLPKPPSPMPWFTLGASMVLCGLYALFQGWAWMGWVVLALAPFVSAILPMEINDFLRRKRICEHIRRDFLDESEMDNDHSTFLAALHEEKAYSNSGEYRPIQSDWSKSSSDFQTVSSSTR